MMKNAGTKDKNTCEQLKKIKLVKYSQLQQFVLAEGIPIAE